MDIAIYYQKWDEKKKNSHTLLEQAVRRYARENALLLPETLILASTEQKKKPWFQNAESIHFSISHSGAWWSCAVSTEEIGLDIQQEQHCRAELWPDVFIIRWKWHGWRKMDIRIFANYGHTKKVM